MACTARTPNPKPVRGDLVRCDGCGAVRRHTRLLHLCAACGRSVRVVARPRNRARPFAAAVAGLFGGRPSA